MKKSTIERAAELYAQTAGAKTYPVHLTDEECQEAEEAIVVALARKKYTLQKQRILEEVINKIKSA
jgi:hypothetical protein